MYKILLVEDDKDISEMICDYLQGEGFEVVATYEGEQARNIIKADTFDLALVDLTLPKCSGFDVIKAIRAMSTMPIIIVTAKDSDADKTLGFNLGADDYVSKPFSIVELTARIKANIRRATQYIGADNQSNHIIKVKDLKIYISEYKVERGEEIINLTHKEFDILYLLAKNTGRAFSKEQIYNLVWEEPYYGNEGVLNSHMNRLRNKLKKGNTEDFEYIKTLWGIGYKMEDE